MPVRTQIDQLTVNVNSGNRRIAKPAQGDPRIAASQRQPPSDEHRLAAILALHFQRLLQNRWKAGWKLIISNLLRTRRRHSVERLGHRPRKNLGIRRLLIE